MQKILVVYSSEKTRGFFLEISVLVQVEYMVVGGESRLGCGGFHPGELRRSVWDLMPHFDLVSLSRMY